ncbi:hypothetical protein Ddc_10087 [Ditylenchus destructor]|nr:hypothetical protein Ddc_10087 [Ditylenchus destructor]
MVAAFFGNVANNYLINDTEIPPADHCEIDGYFAEQKQLTTLVEGVVSGGSLYKGIVLAGDNGVGKKLLVRKTARHKGMQLIHTHASYLDLSNTKLLFNIANNCARNNKKIAILLEDIDQYPPKLFPILFQQMERG